MKRILFLGLFVSALMALQAQVIRGRVVNMREEPVEFANIVLLSLPDSAFVQGAVSGADGAFSMNADCTNGLLRVSCVGYTTLFRDCSGADAGIFQLDSDARMLNEVVVKGNLPKTRVKAGGLLTTVAGSVLEKAGTAEDLLDRIPGVSAGNGSVSVFGRGSAEVYINGRKVRDSSELDRLASSNIKSVEVINNPGARYAASVKAVIRITTKQPQGEGFGFNNRAYAKYNKEWTVLDQFNFNYRKKGFDLSGMLSASDGRGWSKKEVVQDTYLDQHWHQQSPIDEKEHSQSLSATLSGNYTFNKDHAVGLRYSFRRMPKYDNWGTMDTRVQRGEEVDELLHSDLDSWMQQTRHLLNFYYVRKIGKWNMDFNADALWNTSSTGLTTDETATDAGGTLTDKRQVNSLSDSDNELYAAKLIFSGAFLGGELSVGGEYSHNRHGNDYLNPEGILQDDHSEIREGDAAGFLEYNRTFGPVSVQAGLRFEHVASDYYVQGERVDEQSRHYNDWFPSLMVAWPVGKAQMALTYATDIVRPSYHALRGNITYNNRYTYESGNPLLQPQKSQNVLLNAAYEWVQLTVGYSHVKDAIVTTSRPYSEDTPSIALLANTNTSPYDRMFASLTLAPTIGIWSPQVTASLSKQWYWADTPWGRKNLSDPFVSLSWDNSLQLPMGFTLDADVSWSSCGFQENTEITRRMWSANLMLFKSVLKGKLTFQLRGTDLFNTARYCAMGYLGDLRTIYSNQEPNSRSVSLTVRYKFNVARNKYKGTGAGSSQKDRM